jgi:hypothetical protein
MNIVSQQRESELAPAIRSIKGRGDYDVIYVPGPAPGGGKYRVSSPRREHAPSYFSKAGLIALAACESRSTFLATLNAAQVVNKHFPVEETNPMTTKKKSKRSAKGAGEPILKPSERKRASKQAAEAGDGAAPAAKSSKKAARAERPKKEPKEKQPREKLGAAVEGSTPELLTYLDKFQGDTIERMNGGRVVELVVNVLKSTVDEPVTRKGLTVYPQRIAREMVRLGIFKQEHLDGVGLSYFPSNGLKKFVPATQ